MNAGVASGSISAVSQAIKQDPSPNKQDPFSLKQDPSPITQDPLIILQDAGSSISLIALLTALTKPELSFALTPANPITLFSNTLNMVGTQLKAVVETK